MSTSVPTPVAQVDSDMVQPHHAPQPASASSPNAAAARPSLRGQIAENPLTALLGSLLVALLTFTLVTSNARITGLEGRITALEAGITRLEDKIDARFATQDKKIDEVESKIDEIHLKLTALIAGLGMTSTVDRAIEGPELSDPAG